MVSVIDAAVPHSKRHFFSSRRRHTRYWRDWSSDVCSSDLGWGSLWMKDNDRFNSGEPGIGLDVARWVVEKQAALVGADTWATEVVPNPDPNAAFVVHQELITKNGIFNHENLDFGELLAAGVHEFVYVLDRKSTRLNSSHANISYAVFCLKKKTTK